MLIFLLRRLLSSVVVLFIIVSASFFIMRFAPGSPLSDEKARSAEVEENLRRQYNLDRSLGEQYAITMKKIAFDWDFGYSFTQRDKKVNDIIASAAPYSFQIGLQALILAIMLGVPAGLFAGLKPNSGLDYAAMTFALVGVSVPNFVIGPLLILGFSFYLGWFDPTGWDEWSDTLLPSLTLALYYAAYMARLTRSGMLEVARQDYIRTARAKGLRERVIVARHALKGSLLPVVSYLGPAFAGMLTGSVVIERIFSLPGLGTHFVTGALNRDYSVVLATIVLYSVILVLLNLLVDISYSILDPRVRLT